MDSLLFSAWRFDRIVRGARGGGGTAMAELDRYPEPHYIWRQGRIEVTVEWREDCWHVLSSSCGRLIGSRATIYEAKHKLAKFAAWDVMACVIRASQNEEEGVNEGRKAARWMVDRRSTE